MKLLSLLMMLALLTGLAAAQTIQPDPQVPNQNAAISIDLNEAIKLAKINAPQFRAAAAEAGIAHEDAVQARAALLPGVSFTNSAIYTQPNGTDTGKFIGANGPHEYISQGVASEHLSVSAAADFRSKRALEAVAKAKQEIALRGLVSTVVQNFCGMIVARRLSANAKRAADEAAKFLDISRKLENGGEVAHSDVIKAQLQANELSRTLQEATLAEDKARLALAVLIFPTFTTDFDVVDDLRFAPPLPPIADVQRLAANNNPELKSAVAAAAAANHDVASAIGGHLPELSLNYFYGIDAPQFATRTDGIRNLGYQVSATIDVPIWNWGATQSKIKQAKLRRTVAQIELSAAQREALADLRTFYAEAQLARDQVATLRQSADLAAESLRLTNLRYQAGEASVFEVVDAQNALSQARNNYDNGEVRYRVAIANLQTLTGTF